MLTRRHRLAQGSDEQGSLIVALIIIMVVVALGAVLAAQAIGNETIVVNRQSNFSAVASADAGAADALFRIDQGTAGTGTGAYFCVKPGDLNCVAASVPGAPGVVRYLVTPNGSTKWTIQSVGTVNGVSAAIQESVSRSALYPFALFGNTGLTFNGNAGNAFATYTSTQSDSATNPNGSGAVSIGSNGTISCSGGLGNNVTSVYYTGGGGVSGSCGTPQAVSTLYNLPIPQAPNGALPCPGSGVGGTQFGSGIAGAPTTLFAGTYVCTSPITISGNLSINGTDTVALYVILDPSVYNSSTDAIDIAGDSTINAAASYATGATLPNATQLQLLSNTTGTVGDSNGHGYTFGGILNAPQASLTGNGCKSVYYGALTINTLTCNGGPHLQVNYDSDLSSLYGTWGTSGYLQIAPASVTIP